MNRSGGGNRKGGKDRPGEDRRGKHDPGPRGTGQHHGNGTRARESRTADTIFNQPAPKAPARRCRRCWARSSG